ncbi:MAG: hypothetical protein RIR26_2691 [Pseudomonadota bacterium]|jgi:muconate cycloisomerase
MKPVRIKLHELQIPFVEAFAHSAKSRTASDSFVVEIEFDNGMVGYGEGVSRPYVTGETVEASVDHILHKVWPVLLNRDIAQDALNLCQHFPDAIEGNVAFHGAQAAVELALIDSFLRSNGTGLHQVLPASPEVKQIRYSGVITASSAEGVRKTAKKLKLFGITEYKLKIDRERVREQIACAREAIGPDASLRVDGNSDFSPDEVIDLDSEFQSHHIAAIEQPTPRLPAKVWADLQKRLSIPIVADESFVTEEDAISLIENKACQIFNLRIAKCGGVGRLLKLARRIKSAGLRYQLGCQVGETCILSAAARTLAAHLGDCLYVEGSYGNLLLSEDICRDRYQFGFGGLAPLNAAVGLGVDIVREKLERATVRTVQA